METVRAHIIISGRVQGVFYRAGTRDKAIKIGLKGWVKNLSNSNVEAIFEGEKNKVDEMIEWCRIGPSYARVDNISVTWEDAKGYKSFEVKYS